MNAAASLFTKAFALSAGGLLATAQLALAGQPTTSGSGTPVMATADYTVTYTCTAGPGCSLGNGYQHTYTLNIDIHGAITGTGTQTGWTQVQENVNGTLAQPTASLPASLDYLSTYGGTFFAGYVITETGSVDAATGDLNGSATASLPGNPQWDANFSVKGTRTAVTFINGGGAAGPCVRPGNSANPNACDHSQAANHSESANFNGSPTAPGQLAKIDGTPANANSKGHGHQPRGHKAQ